MGTHHPAGVEGSTPVAEGALRRLVGSHLEAVVEGSNPGVVAVVVEDLKYTNSILFLPGDKDSHKQRGTMLSLIHKFRHDNLTDNKSSTEVYLLSYLMLLCMLEADLQREKQNYTSINIPLQNGCKHASVICLIQSSNFSVSSTGFCTGTCGWF